MKTANVVALYVDPDGPYPDLVEDWYDEKRDARTYQGPHPVIAHPPCGPWGKMRHLCTKQDASCGPSAFASVRKYGGVLEQPEHSRLFHYCEAPLPGEMVPDAFGGLTHLVRQVSWGHSCDKPTWLYTVGVPYGLVVPGIREGGKATHRVTSGPRGPQLPSATKKARAATPIAFARWLVSLATAAKAPK